MDSDYIEILSNPIIVALLVVAAVTYCLLMELLLVHSPKSNWVTRVNYWNKPLSTLISALPLLGLLGTINGLLTTFNYISINHGLSQNEIMSGGISDALLTTQLGLILAVPGLILKQLLAAQYKQQTKEVV